MTLLRPPRSFRADSSMADPKAGAQAPDDRLIILPVDLEDASVEAVSWAAKNVLRHGARKRERHVTSCAAASRSDSRFWLPRAARALGLFSLRLSTPTDAAVATRAPTPHPHDSALTLSASCAGDSALLLHVIPATYPVRTAAGPTHTRRVRCSRARCAQTLEPALGLGGEGVFASVPDPEAEQLRVRFCVHGCFRRLLSSAHGMQREAAEKFIANKLVPLLKDVPGISVRHAVLRFATDADSVGRVICTNAEELGAAMVVLPTHGKGAALGNALLAFWRSHTLHLAGRLRELFMGSTANYCTHHSRVPVLVLR